MQDVTSLEDVTTNCGSDVEQAQVERGREVIGKQVTVPEQVAHVQRLH
jgi:hypothetical protein